jgi:hypothetical protein
LREGNLDSCLAESRVDSEAQIGGRAVIEEVGLMAGAASSFNAPARDTSFFRRRPADEQALILETLVWITAM